MQLEQVVHVNVSFVAFQIMCSVQFALDTHTLSPVIGLKSDAGNIKFYRTAMLTKILTITSVPSGQEIILTL